MGILPHLREYNFVDLLISWVHSFTSSYLCDIDKSKMPLLLIEIKKVKKKKWKAS